MKKGDERRQAIVEAAEKLFYENGFENTSIQDVLTQTGISKGGFYHHFESKLKLLEEICSQRTEAGYARSQAAVDACEGDAVKKLNAMFAQGGFFEEDSLDYISLMIRVIYRDGCVQLRDMMQRQRLRRYDSLLTGIIHQGVQQKLFYTPYPDCVGRLVLMLNNDLTDEIALRIAKREEDREDLMNIVDLLNAYRCSVERILNAPYGSIELVELTRVAEVARSIGAQDRRRAGSGDVNLFAHL